MTSARIGTLLALASLLLLTHATPSRAAWLEYQKLTAGGGVSHDHFGNSVSLDGTTALVGAWAADGGSKEGSAYVFGDFGSTWAQTAKLAASVRVADAEFGHSVSLDGTRALVGAPYDLKGTPIGIRAGSAYVFEHNGSSWSHVAKLTASDAGHQDAFGYAVSLSYSGTVALVGAYADKDEGWYAGSAYVFWESSPGVWSQMSKLTASHPETQDQFGRSVSLSGTTALVGAPGEGTGSVYVFQYAGGTTWAEVAELTASDGAWNDSFGHSVALDGTRAVVGAHGDDFGLTENTGSAYVFEYSGGSWNQVAKLVASDRKASDFFGSSVSLDGATVVVGANYGDAGPTTNAGAAYVFKETAPGVWTQTAKITASDAAPYDGFGNTVSLDGTTALVGASADDDGGDGTGSAYLFSHSTQSDFMPAAVADHLYTLSANQASAAMDGSGSEDDNGIVHYLWAVNESIAYSGPLASTALRLQDAIAFGLTDQMARLPVVLTVTDTIGQANSALSTLSYEPFDAVIHAFSATVDGDLVKFDFRVQDDDLPVNALSPGWQTLALEIDDLQALAEADVAALGAYWFDLYGGTDAIIGPDDVGIGSTVDLPLGLFPAGANTVWLNIAGSHDSMSATFWNHYPEPGTLTLLALGGLGLLRRRRRAA